MAEEVFKTGDKIWSLGLIYYKRRNRYECKYGGNTNDKIHMENMESKMMRCCTGYETAECYLCGVFASLILKGNISEQATSKPTTTDFHE